MFTKTVMKKDILLCKFYKTVCFRKPEEMKKVREEEINLVRTLGKEFRSVFSNPYIKVTGCLCVSVYVIPMISLTAEPIWFSFSL